jgi:hypothetical protein
MILCNRVGFILFAHLVPEHDQHPDDDKGDNYGKKNNKQQDDKEDLAVEREIPGEASGRFG